MNESGDQQQQQQQRAGSSVNPKIASDSGYGSNKSTQRSSGSNSGSSKSHESSVSSESSSAYPPHPDAPVSIAECQTHPTLSPSQGGGAKRQGKKKSKSSDRKQSIGEKPDVTLPQSIDQNGTSNVGSTTNLSSGGHSQQQASQIMSPGSKASSTHDSKALQMAALTHALRCMKKFNKPLTDSEINEEDNGEIGTTSGKNWQEYFSNDIKVDDAGNEDTFASVVSLDDGIIVYITPSISNILGFPKDMLEGRSFIDFVHPKDRMAFASHITCGMSFPMGEQQSQGSNTKPTGAARVKSEPFYCRLRQYRGLKTVGFGVVDKTVLYHPFKLSMTLKKVEQPQKGEAGGDVGDSKVGADNKMDGSRGDGGTNELTSIHKDAERNDEDMSNKASSPTSVNLVIVANRIKSAYQFSDEIPSNPGKFVTRHSASCHFGHMDSEAISYLGHLPQDLIGNSVLDYYHPDDMILMKDIYEGVMQEQGKPFRSKPYRFRVHNGTFAMLETDWSCFINPWSWKLEFVIGQHRVVKGPGNPNVFMQPTDAPDKGKSAEAEEILEESKELQSEIKKLLTETVTRRLSLDPLRQQSSRRRKGLAALMESLLEGMAKTENSDKSGSQCSGMFSVMERDSVMLGEISPHHDDQSGSNQSSETPPSYNQLNYRENIERFFHSHPKTVRSDESAEMDTSGQVKATQPVNNRSSDSDNSKSSPNIDYSSGSNIRLSSGSVSNENESGDRDTCASPLTEERLSRHNEAMEKYMIQRHRELRGKSSMTPGSHKEGRHRHSEKAETSHGLKRTGNSSWDGDNTHSAKQPHLECLPGRNHPSIPGGAPGPPGCCAGHGHNSINLWPPFSIAMTPGITTPTYRSAGIGAGTGVAGAGGANYPSNFPGLAQSYNTSPPGREGVPRSSGKVVPEPISMSATTPNAPLLFVPSHHHHQHPHQHQYVPQQVQLFPAGVVYQPLGSFYGQPSSIMMPAGFLGTMMHPDPSPSTSKGDAIGTAAMPKLSEQNKRGPFASRKYNTNKGLSSKTVPGRGGGGNYGRNHVISGTSISLSSSSACQGNPNMMMGNEGSGSEESLNSSFFQNQSNSDAADQDVWGNGRRDGDQTMEESNNKASGTPRPIRNKNPPWLENVEMTADLMYRYRIPPGDLSDVLQKDLKALKIFGKQSTMVNDQLGMLYNELKLEGTPGNSGPSLNLEEGVIGNSSSGDENNAKEGESEPRKAKKPVAAHQYSKMVILYEENSPFPPESDTSPPKKEAEV